MVYSRHVASLAVRLPSPEVGAQGYRNTRRGYSARSCRKRSFWCVQHRHLKVFSLPANRKGAMLRRSAALVSAALLLAIGLVACGAREPESRPQPSAAWDGGRIDEVAIEPEPRMSLTISSGGNAQLANMPEGQWERTDSGICWDDTGGLYSGPATWSWFAESGIEVKFEDSAVIFWAWPGKFGSYDWSAFKMVNCRGDRTWGMSLTCGSAGTVDLTPCKVPSD